MAITAETIEGLIKKAGNSLNRAKTCHPAMAQDYTLAAISNLLEIVKRQEQRHQQAAQALDDLAKAIGYPINNTREMRERVRAIAAIVRGDKANEGNGDVGDR